MKSYYNIQILQNLYRLEALGYEYADEITYNHPPSEPIAEDFDTLTKQIHNCHLCDLSKTRTQSMSGYGSYNAEVMIIDDIVSQSQDMENNYFAGRSGDMLKNMIENVLSIPKENIYYTHAIKCKPHQPKENYQSEWLSCRLYLETQIELVNPKIILFLGEKPFRRLTGSKEPFEHIRGNVLEYKNKKIISTYEPDFLLRNPNFKKVVLNDLQTLKSHL